MKKFILVFVFIFSFLSSCTSDETTTYYLIRHAEKDRTDTTNNNPDLNVNGLKRAEKWAKYFDEIDLDAVYSTHYNRTQQTAKPTSESKNLKIISYDPKEMNDAIFKQATIGKTVLVVGHSNTTPAFANKILGEKKYEDISDNDNASLYIVTIAGDKKMSSIEKIGE
ncbi:SixA phosphatase family protein [Polaribacter sp. IC073]|uniref:SixA phosphatase family protein n=1 Tax=Polaribacter sp. IC073 TaxID=2508540 RepID=UPI0011BDAA2E|nr:phosphoglycerate mutase family protein [Polaribacter sp. IC073]TXD49337.1 histidine phosphatase family protein [Polaribacter sp. IC073]